MFDSLPYRNDAAVLFGRLARLLPFARSGVSGRCHVRQGFGVMALAGLRELPTVPVPGGVTLPRSTARTRARYKRSAHGSRADCSPSMKPRTWAVARAERGRRLSVPSARLRFASGRRSAWTFAAASALASIRRSGVAHFIAIQSARASLNSRTRDQSRDIITDIAIHNAMAVHAAFGGSTNPALHVPAIAHAAKLRRPTCDDWIAINRKVPRPFQFCRRAVHHPTVRAFRRRRAGGCRTCVTWACSGWARAVAGKTLGENLVAWERFERPPLQEILSRDAVSADDIICHRRAQERGLTSTHVSARYLAPEGSVLKSTASILPSSMPTACSSKVQRACLSARAMP
jgi:dihydroxyacid dehydratase/phosphogluconate dehydratase